MLKPSSNPYLVTVLKLNVPCPSRYKPQDLEPMPRDERKDHCKDRSDGNTDRFDPQCPHEKQLADVRFADPDEAERGGLGLLEEGEERGERVECR